MTALQTYLIILLSGSFCISTSNNKNYASSTLSSIRDGDTTHSKITRDNGNVIIYSYVDQRLVSEVERYPKGNLCSVRIYTTPDNDYTFVSYYPNGKKSWERISGDHTYETFYENGKLQCKGGYGFTIKDRGQKYYNLYELRLYDSIWKRNGQFDSVRRYSKASITY